MTLFYGIRLNYELTHLLHQLGVMRSNAISELEFQFCNKNTNLKLFHQKNTTTYFDLRILEMFI